MKNSFINFGFVMIFLVLFMIPVTAIESVKNYD